MSPIVGSSLRVQGEQRGDEWMPFWRINRKLPWSRREHEELRDTLLLQRLIEVQQTSGSRGLRGRPGLVYRLAITPNVAKKSLQEEF